MNQITAYTDKTIISMTSREIAELCDKRHDNVMADCRKLSEFYTQTYSPEKSGELVKSSTYVDSTGRSLLCFALDKPACIDLVTGYSLPHRHAVNKRWQELEEQANRPATPKIPPTYAAALLEAGRLAQLSEIQAEKLAVLAPKAQALDLIAADDKSLTVTQAAKVLGIKRDNLTNWLNANGWIYRQNGSWVAYQQHIQNGRLIYKEARYTDDLTGQETYRPYCHITSKGLVVLAEEFGGQELAA